MNYKKHHTDTKTFFLLLEVSGKRAIFRQVTGLKIALLPETLFKSNRKNVFVLLWGF